MASPVTAIRFFEAVGGANSNHYTQGGHAAESGKMVREDTDARDEASTSGTLFASSWAKAGVTTPPGRLPDACPPERGATSVEFSDFCLRPNRVSG